jgi:methanethiol S-methyltransferase
MTETEPIGSAIVESRRPRFTAFLLDGVAYLTLLSAILYAIGFLSDFIVPKAIDTGAESGIIEAIVVNILLISLFFTQHSAIAHRLSKHRWTQYIPQYAERRIRTLCAGLALLLLFWQWRPMPAVIWHVHEPEKAMAIATLSFMGWVIFVTNTVTTNQLELFQLPHDSNGPVQREVPALTFNTPLFHRLVRHRIYLGFAIGLWAAPTMSVGHLLLSATITIWIFIGFMLEQYDFAGMFKWEHGLLHSWRRLN